MSVDSGEDPEETETVDKPRRLRVHSSARAREVEDESESASEESEEDEESVSEEDRDFDGLELLRAGRLAETVVAYERSTSRENAATSRQEAREMLEDLEAAKRNPTMAAFLRMGEAGDVGKRRRRSRKRKTARSKHMLEADELMSEATILYARGEFAEAVNKLHAAVVKIPNSSEPYEQLALVYEETNNLEKALDCYSLATAVKRRVDPSMWYRMATMAVNLNKKEYALHCLSKASRADPHNYENKMDQATLYRELGDTKKAIEQLEWVLRDDLPLLNGDLLREASVMLAKSYYAVAMRDRAEYALELMLEKHLEHVDATVVNILIELKMESHKYAEVLAIVDKAHANIVERAEAGKIPLDISVKLGQCLLYEGRTDEGLKQIFELLGHDVNEFDDLFFDGGNTMMEVGLPSKAEVLFRELLTVEEYDNIDIWQRIETCIQQSKGNQGVIEFYESLHDKHPSDVFVAVSLADALSNVQDDEECARRASSLISNLDEVEVQNYGIFLRVTALQRKLLTKDELMVLIPSALKLMADLIEKRSLRKLQRTGKAGEDFVDDNVRISDDDVFASIISGAEVALRLGKFEDSEKIVNDALSFSAGSVLTREQTASLRYLKALIAYEVCDFSEAASNCRSILEVFPTSVTVWNMLMQMAVNYPRALSVGTSKLAKRLVTNSVDEQARKHVITLMASGHVHSWNKKWSIAMHNFLTALSFAPNDQEVCLSAAISLLHMTTRNSNEHQRHALALRAIVLLERSAELNSAHPQEGLYNLARGFHHLGWSHLARPLYEKCLETPVGEGDGVRPSVNLAREAAYNLSLIYRKSNANGLARAILRKYMAF